MTAQVGALRVAVGADISGLTAGMKRAERQVKSSAGVMSRAVKGVNTSLAGLGSIAGVTLGGAGLLAGAGAFIKIADAAKSLQAQLKLATSEYGSFAKAQEDVRGIAERSRSDLVETARLYSAIQRASGELGITQQQTARATETISKSFRISGATAVEATNATRQLVQALQAGRLSGDEFRSVMENAPRAVKLLADSLGVPISALREMSKEGELTADKLVKAFTDKKFTAGIDEEFRQLPVTFDQAMGQVYNAAVIVFSAFDRGGQFSTSLANFVSDGTEGFTKLEERAYSFGTQVGDLITVFEVVRDALGSLQSDGVLGFGSLTDATYTWRDALTDVLIGIDRVANAFANLANLPGNAIRTAFPGLGLKPIVDPVNLAGEFQKRTDAQDLKRRFDRAREASREAANAGRVPPPFRAPSGKAKKGRTARAKASPRDRSEDVEFQFAQELRQAQADVLRAQQSMAVTNEERARIALLLLDAERQGKEAELNDRVRRAERDFAEKKITAGALRQVKTQADKLRAEYDSVDALERQAIANKLAAQKAEDAAELVDADFDLRLEKLQIEASLKETTSERLDVELRILDLMKEQERVRLEATIADTEASETAKEIAKARLAELDAIYAGKADAARQGNRSPVQDYKARYSDIAQENEEAFVSMLEGVSDALSKATDGLKELKESLLDTFKTFFQTLLKNQLNQLFASLLPSGGFKLPAFATGGSFTIGGRAGIDNNIMSINGLPVARVSYGERINVSNDNGRNTYSRGDTTVNINGVRDFDSFRRNERQTGRAARRVLGI